MGEIADDMIEGRACDLCGCYFIHREDGEIFEHGYPATCNQCWNKLTKEEKKYHQKAIADTL